MPEAPAFESLFAQVEAHMKRWALEDATRLLEGAKAAGPVPNRVHHDLSILYAQQGFFAEALFEIELAMAGDPSNRAVWHHFLATQKNNPVQPTPLEWRAMHLGYGDTLRERGDKRYTADPKAKGAGQRLRVGYLCPDTHLATERFVWPVLEHFDGAGYEVFAYWCHSPETAAFEKRYPKVRHRAILGLDDDQVAGMIVGDAIDIVVDVAGHGAGNRLPVLALRPAPVRMTWLDYLATTGLDAVDYRITDAIADPPGAEAAHVEKLLRLDVAPWCYRPHPEATADVAPSGRSREDVVFGSVCVPLKLSDTVLDLWTRLLRAVPGSTLRFLGIPEGRARERIVARFAAAGLDAKRIEMLGRLSQADFFRALSELDIVLDSHPFSGATSTLDALWQGVPVVTIAGELSHGRSTASILTALGKGEWIAETPEQFVAIAAELAGEAGRLKVGRASLRAALRSSSLCDGIAFARAMEKAFAHGWSTALARHELPPRESQAAFWGQFQALSKREAAEPVDRVLLRDLGDEWVVIEDGRFADLHALEVRIPRRLIESFDVLGAVGVDRMRSGNLLSVGAGHVAGLTLLGDEGGPRLYASVYVPDSFGRCVALTGSRLLVRRRVLAALAARPVDDAASFRAELARLSHELHRSGARLGVATSLAAPERPVAASASYRAERMLETQAGLLRWSQETASAVPFKAALPAAHWHSLWLPAFEALCDPRGDDRGGAGLT